MSKTTAPRPSGAGDAQRDLAPATPGGKRGRNIVEDDPPSRRTPSALRGWSPPDLPAGGGLARRVDRVLPRSGIGCVVYWAVVVALAYGVAPHLPVRGRLGVEGVAALAAGAWCAVNFWRCRHAHCLVSGPGWLALGILGIVGTLAGHTVICGFEQLAFLGVLAVALAFEAAWRSAQGTSAVRRPRRPPR